MRQHDEQKSIHGGEQRLFKFANGYGASVIRHEFSYGFAQGKWELAVLAGPNQELCYTTPLTDDVIGYLSEEGVDDLLSQIETLPPL